MPSPKRTQLALLLSVTLPLAACQHLTNTAATDLPPEVDPVAVACQAFKPITWSSRDTRETAIQIVSHNAAFEALCQPNQ